MSALLPAASLARLRAVAEAAMVDSADVLRATTAPDGMGGTTETWTTAATYPCRVARLPQQATEREVAEQLQGRIAFTLYLPVGADVRGGDRLGALGETYEVLGVVAPLSDQALTRCTCARIEAV